MLYREDIYHRSRGRPDRTGGRAEIERNPWTKPPAAAPIPTVTAAAAPPPATFPVICPHGAGPGSHLRVRAPNTGQEMTVIVPAGVGADAAS